MNKKVIGMITVLSILTVGTEFKTNTYVKAEERTVTTMSESDFVINNGVLEKYTGNDKNVVIPEGVTEIGADAFSGCSKLSSIKLPEGVTEIGNRAFSGCSNLKSIEIPKSVKEIEGGKEAFYNTKWLEKQKEANQLVIINDILIDINESKIDKNVVIPEEVKEIGDGAFEYCDKLESIELPEGVKTIGTSAFSGCSNLESIKLPEGVKEIGGYAFSYCSNLESIEIPKSVKEIGHGAFWGTKWLEKQKEANQFVIINDILIGINESKIDKNVVIPEGVKEIGYNAFSGCSKLESIEIPEGLTKIGMIAFSGCSKLESIEIPKSVKEIGSGAFRGTKWLEKQKKANQFVIINDILIDINKSKIDKNVVIPKGVKAIGNNAFENSVFEECINLESIELPEGLETIGDSAFSECSELSSIKLPEGVKEIEGYAFSGCSKLESIEIPKSVKEIGHGAFWNTKWLEKQKEANQFLIINDILIGINESKIDKNVVIPEGVTEIGHGAFEHCDKLESIKIPEGVKKIGDFAFSGCWKLESIEIPKSVKEIGSFYFWDSWRDSISTTIKGYSGSYAETYAKAWDIQFTVIGGDKVTLKTPTLKSLKAVTGKKLKLTINQSKDADGYEIVYAANKSFKNSKTKKIANKTTYMLTGLKTGRYYVKIRAYKISSSKEKTYSKYSKVLTAKVK